MRQGQLCRVQHLPRSRIPCALREGLVRPFAIGLVADQWEANVVKVHSDLVRSTGMQLGFEQGGGSELFEHAIACPRIAPVPLRDGHALAVTGMTGNGGPDFT